ncbi:MAG: Gfo/Idh/MocA family oxidoreductase [Bacteroidales bacterium]|nr:Gfo/Idh/MocA family oxidoreductase [Bacteroidales bacterium]
MGLASLGLSVTQLNAENFIKKQYYFNYDGDLPKPERKITAIIAGAGNRGNVYGNYALKHPDELDIVGVAEPIEIRRQRYAEKHEIPADKVFYTWEQLFEIPKFADAVIITTPDKLHYGPAMKALSMGYDLLLEKPIAQSWQQCKDILDLATENNRIVAVCHVLRYSPYYRKVKETIDSGVLGEIVSVQHMEPIQHEHMSHSYVRGNWRREEDNVPILLAKSCHDLDIMRWWLGKSCEYVSSFGSLKWFKEQNAPKGAPLRCTDGCPAEKECPYSALKIYYRNRTYLHHFDLPDDKNLWDEAIMKNLEEGPYGRCVYHCDNDVPDHQVVSMQFEDEITANFNMEAFTEYYGRRTRIMGTMGDLVGDETDLYIHNFRTGEVTQWNVHENADISSGHGGGDYGLARDFLHAVSKQDSSLLTSTLAASMESHLIGFKAEESRHTKKIVQVDIRKV